MSKSSWISWTSLTCLIRACSFGEARWVSQAWILCSNTGKKGITGSPVEGEWTMRSGGIYGRCIIPGRNTSTWQNFSEGPEMQYLRTKYDAFGLDAGFSSEKRESFWTNRSFMSCCFKSCAKANISTSWRQLSVNKQVVFFVLQPTLGTLLMPCSEPAALPTKQDTIPHSDKRDIVTRATAWMSSSVSADIA